MIVRTPSPSVRYCTQLLKNVVIQQPAGGFICLNSHECGFADCGCRNLLICPEQRDKREATDTA